MRWLTHLLTHGVFRILPHSRGVKPEHNIVLGDTERHEFCSDVVFSAIPLNPDLALFDIEVYDWPENALRVMPSVIQQLIVIVFRIKNRLRLYPLIASLEGALRQ
jgi:hypothetical protein